MGSSTERMQRISERLARLRGAGWERYRDVHGVSSHRFELGRRASDATLAAFEREHDVALVPEHRAFLAEVGDGGAGPAHGIMRLCDALCGPSPDAPADRTFLCTPYRQAFGASIGAEWSAGGDDPELALRTAGTMTVCETGCGGFVQLVVTGPARGRLLSLDIDGHRTSWLPDAGFLDWYEAWLEPFFDPVRHGRRLEASTAELDAYGRALRR